MNPWNDGIVECWNIGHEKQMKINFTKNVVSTFYDDAHRTSFFFSFFAPENTPLLRENQYNYVRFVSLNPPAHYPRTHNSNIPEFQNSNWGEAPNLHAMIFNKSA